MSSTDNQETPAQEDDEVYIELDFSDYIPPTGDASRVNTLDPHSVDTHKIFDQDWHGK